MFYSDSITRIPGDSYHPVWKEEVLWAKIFCLVLWVFSYSWEGYVSRAFSYRFLDFNFSSSYLENMSCRIIARKMRTRALDASFGLAPGILFHHSYLESILMLATPI